MDLFKRTDPLANGVRLVVAIGSFAAKPGLVSGLKAGLSIHDTLKKMIASAPPGIGVLADELTLGARAVFDGFARDLPRDADLLYEQMVIATLPDPKVIVENRMKADQITSAMVEMLSDREHVSPPVPDLFRDLTEPVLARLLAEKSFAADLTPAWMAGVLKDLEEQTRILRELEEKYGSLAKALDALADAKRDQLVAIAAVFSVEVQPGMADRDLRAQLELKAEDHHKLATEIKALKGLSERFDNIYAAALDALDNLRLDEARRLLRDARDIHRQDTLMPALEKNARLMETEAEVELLDGRIEEAYRILSGAADSFASFDPLEPAWRRNGYAQRLYNHGLRYGGTGLVLSADMLRAALTVRTREDHPVDWAMTQQNLATALAEQGRRTAGPNGTALLAEAVEAFRAALTVRTREDHPAQWAMTQQNLAGALRNQGSRTAGSGGAALLAEAVAAYRAALTVFTREDHPVQWATTQQNLANALQTQGSRTAGPDGAALLAEAVEAFRAALTVRTREDHPVDWATTQQNLGNALTEQGRRTAGPGGAALLAEAVEAFRAALTVVSREDHPVQWAATQQNLGNALGGLGIVTKGTKGTEYQMLALKAYEDSLRIRTQSDHPVDWAVTQHCLSVTLVEIADHDATPEPRPHLEAALGHVEAALTVFDPEHMSHDHDIATRLRDQIRARLAAL